MKFYTIIFCALLGCVTAFSKEHSNHNHHNHTYGPIGVMGDHVHKEGDFMLSYRYSQMRMDKNKNGHHKISDEEILQTNMVAPKWMTMEMHMFGIMYAASEDLTLMAMLPYIKKGMGHVNRARVDFNTHSEGFGDTKITALYRVLSTGSGSVHVNLGLSLPSGSTDKKDATFLAPRVRLPYPMQLGSGTVDPIVGFTYTDSLKEWSWGFQTLETFRTRENRHNYQLGNEYTASAWFTQNWTEKFSQSLRLKWQLWENIHGQDVRLNPGMVTTMNPDKRAGKRIDLLAGFSWDDEKSGQRFTVEGGFPIHENLDGPQLSTDFILNTGWQWLF